MRLAGKTAIISGGARGLGEAMAKLFAENGAKIITCDMGDPQYTCDNVEFYKLDVTNADACKQFTEYAVGKYQKIDILINNAGIFTEGTVTQTDFSMWRKILSVNVDGAFLCAKYACESMLRTGGGTVINIASEAGLSALPGQTAYNVSKAALIMMSQSMAVDYALKNIRVNCVCPGRVMTPLVQHFIDTSPDPDATFKKLSSDRPVMRMGNPKDMAYACLHFADDSMPYATGAILSVDGGATAR